MLGGPESTGVASFSVFLWLVQARKEIAITATASMSSRIGALGFKSIRCAGRLKGPLFYTHLAAYPHDFSWRFPGPAPKFLVLCVSLRFFASSLRSLRFRFVGLRLIMQNY